MLMKYNDLESCASCADPVLFVQSTDNLWVIANVYSVCGHEQEPCRFCRGTGRRWDRIEHWHPQCYEQSGFPYGEATFRKTKVVRKNDRG